MLPLATTTPEVTALVTAVGFTITAVGTVLQMILSASRSKKQLAVVEEVKQGQSRQQHHIEAVDHHLQTATIELRDSVGEVHSLVNGGNAAMLRGNAVMLRKIANKEKDEESLAAAEEAERKADEAQAISEAAIKRNAEAKTVASAAQAAQAAAVTASVATPLHVVVNDPVPIIPVEKP